MPLLPRQQNGNNEKNNRTEKLVILGHDWQRGAEIVYICLSFVWLKKRRRSWMERGAGEDYGQWSRMNSLIIIAQWKMKYAGMRFRKSTYLAGQPGQVQEGSWAHTHQCLKIQDFRTTFMILVVDNQLAYLRSLLKLLCGSTFAEVIWQIYWIQPGTMTSICQCTIHSVLLICVSSSSTLFGRIFKTFSDELTQNWRTNFKI